MEDASDDNSLTTEMPVPVENGIVSNEPDTNSEESESEPESSGCATPTTTTDSENNLKRKLTPENGIKPFKKVKRCESDFLPPTNPYFNESLFELSGLHQSSPVGENVPKVNGTSAAQVIQESKDASDSPEFARPLRYSSRKKKPANQQSLQTSQFLGLQPIIKFRCKKCHQSGFTSLQLLREHFKKCTGEPIVKPNPETQSEKLLVTRRNVFLCSACSCYYESYNIFIHIYTVHGRFVCLYCSAIYSQIDKFLFHLHNKHNCVPKVRNSDQEFYEAHNQPCYLMCCECGKMFGEGIQEHFYGHACGPATKPAKNDLKTNKIKVTTNKQPTNKSKVKNTEFVEHVTGDTEPSENVDVPDSDSSENVKNSTQVEQNSPLCVSTETTETIETNLSENTENIQNPESIDFVNKNDDLGSPGRVSDVEDIPDEQNPPEETRKVPKVTLKIRMQLDQHPIPAEQEDTDDSDKLAIEMDCCNEPSNVSEPVVNVAGVDIPVTELELEQPLDKFDIRILLQKCLQQTIPTCVYCNYARKISVNGKQLGLHAIAEHRFSGVVNSITAEELIPESFVMRIKESLGELQDVYFSLEVKCDDPSNFARVFECFQCRYATNVHKELYLHNRKMHAKSILLCVMCKSNFLSYSELTCHMCPGLYDQDNELSFRCCICDADDLPSAFRLMVHLRKRHNACDVCLELCHDQSRLSNHVWKHKLHHFCYRCGIAYRNKPDITKHLFWKHGTESVLCKKCLQKKWPHVYHFCMPPTTFTCDDCNLNFTKAIALKVHKRLHNNEKPHACTFENCSEKFISKKLLLKHEFKHREPTEEVTESDSKPETDDATLHLTSDEQKDDIVDVADEPKPKPKVDVLEDLPVLNLSESDSSDSEDDAGKTASVTDDSIKNDNVDSSTIEALAPPVLENIWDDFKNYQAQKEKPSTDVLDDSEPVEEKEPTDVIGQKELVQAIMQDHDYSLLSQEYKNDPHSITTTIEKVESMDHDYCSTNIKHNATTTLEQPTLNDTAANSSSDSDSSCSCGPNCSCSSGSSDSSSDSSNSDSSTSEGRRKQQIRREQRKQRTKIKKVSETSHIDVVATDANPTTLPSVELIIEETDLETTESETDEEFYDKQPQKIANKILAEKRKELMLLAELGPLANGSVMETSRPSTPSLPETEIQKIKPKKSKSKSKKKKRKSKSKRRRGNIDVVYQYPVVSPLSISLPKNSPMSIATPSLLTPPILSTLATSDFMSDLSNNSDSLRASKRRRIPNKFYGYSSDEEEKQDKVEKHQPPILKWRKADLPSPSPAPPPLLVPPITLKAIPTPPVELEQPVAVQSSFHHPHPALFKPKLHDTTESNDSTSEDEQTMPTMNKPLNQPPLYCYCRCPYDEVSEMIGCDADDCLIEWFHFECVGIMVPPKGQWYCPDCRKKRQQRKELSQL